MLASAAALKLRPQQPTSTTRLDATPLWTGPFGKASEPLKSSPTAPAKKISAAPKKGEPAVKPKKKVELGLNLQSARRVTRWIMFPGIFNDFDATEERMKKTIVIKKAAPTKRYKEYYDIRYSDRGLEPADEPKKGWW